MVNNCKCKICGKEFHVRPSQKLRGRGIYCSKKCYNKGRSANFKRDPNNRFKFGFYGHVNGRYVDGKSEQRNRLRTIRRGAERRNLFFGLTLDDIEYFWQKPCFYCGATIKTVGLDRIDNTQGYIKNNVIPCCYMCNRMKSDQSLDEFLNKIEAIYLRTLGGDVNGS